MPAPELRPYQIDVIAKVDAAIDAGKRRVLLPLPTGGGKTVVAAEIIRKAVARGQRVLVLAHRRELIAQAAGKLYHAGVDAGIIQAGVNGRPHVPVQVASVQTLWTRAMRGRAMELPAADLIVVDEAHHVRARTYRKIIEAYAGAIVIGLTATPCRADGRGLGNVFDEIVLCPTVRALIDLGFLVPTKVFAPSIPDLTGVRVERGDYVEKALAEAMDKGALVGDIVTNWHRLAKGRKTVVFATGVAHSVHLRDEFRRAGVMAEHLDGSTPAADRDAILARMSRGEVDVVCNCAVLTEGWDQPDVSCIVLARPTRSVALFRQMIGRVLRPAPGKDHALVLDHAGAVFEHGFVEDAVAWTLREDRRAENETHRARRDDPAGRSLTTCPECTGVRFEGQPCGACGWRPQPKAAAPEIRDGDLGLVDRSRKVRKVEYSDDARDLFYRGLLWIANERDYKPGWAAHQYKAKFGDWPADRFATPAPPDDALRSWVRSRQIAYAKAREKARSA